MEERKTKGILTVVVMAILLYGFAIMCWLKPADDISTVERRPLKQFPELSKATLTSGEFMTEFEEYAMDQVPFRQPLRVAKVTYESILMRRLDYNQMYLSNGYISKLDYPIDSKSIDYATSRFRNIYNNYLKDTDVKVYLSVIPDKNYFNEKNIYPSYDYEILVEKMCNNMEYAEYINIMNRLEMEDYYKTDTHIRQECLIDISGYMAEEMGVSIDTEYDIELATDDFKGVYYNQFGIPMKSEEMYYVTNSTIESCEVYDYENNKIIAMYDFSALDDYDPYEFYLYGPLSLITIENPNATTVRELIIFRDSYGSSFAPLLATGYSKITLVDIRYIQSNILGNFIDFNNQDVLFLYSTSVINNSETIK